MRRFLRHPIKLFLHIVFVVGLRQYNIKTLSTFDLAEICVVEMCVADCNWHFLIVFYLKRHKYLQIPISPQQSHIPVVQALILWGKGGLATSSPGWFITLMKKKHKDFIAVTEMKKSLKNSFRWV